jgi:hypothetical protein
MSGILDSKSRVIDAMVTLEGRRQIADGKLKIEYVSFTDSCTFYERDIVSGSTDASQRISLEACSLPQDKIVFEADDSGRLKPMRNNDHGEKFLRAGQLVEHAFVRTTLPRISGSYDVYSVKRGNAFSAELDNILSSSVDNLQKLYVIGTVDPLFDDEGFSVSPKNVEFVVTNERPIADKRKQTQNINHMESLFNDPRMSNVKNFKYLPPINKTHGVRNKAKLSLTRSRRMGHYPPWGGVTWWHNPRSAYQVLRRELKQFERIGYCKTIIIDPTSRDNNVMCQMFEAKHDTLSKLDVIDYGTFSTGDHNAPVARVFFAGRVVTDDNGTHTFVHLFTLVFE